MPTQEIPAVSPLNTPAASPQPQPGAPGTALLDASLAHLRYCNQLNHVPVPPI